MTFMINSLKQSIPFVIKAIPEVKMESLWLSGHYIRPVLILWQLFQTITPQMCLHLIYLLKSIYIQGKISVLLSIRQI